jgi:hypothetical protein
VRNSRVPNPCKVSWDFSRGSCAGRDAQRSSVDGPIGLILSRKDGSLKAAPLKRRVPTVQTDHPSAEDAFVDSMRFGGQGLPIE